MIATSEPREGSRPAPPGGDGDSRRPVQTGALSGGQPGQGVNTSSSADGQSNVDAVEREGVADGKQQDRQRR